MQIINRKQNINIKLEWNDNNNNNNKINNVHPKFIQITE